MEMQNTLNGLKKHWTTIALVTLLAGGLALLISALQPQEYSSEVKMLIIQKQNFETDTYLAAKSAEKVGKNLSEILTTSSFLDKVVAEGSVDLSAVTSLSSREQREVWSEKVTASVVPDSGLLVITAYDQNPATAEALVVAVANVMSASANEYHGGGDSIVIKTVDKPLTSTHPVRPNLFVNVGVALVVGFALVVAYVFFKADVPFKRAIKIPTRRQMSVTPSITSVATSAPVEQTVAMDLPLPTPAPSYSVLEPSQTPRLEDTSVLSSQTEPVTMHDHLP